MVRRRAAIAYLAASVPVDRVASVVTLSDVVRTIEDTYAPHWAQDGDAIGLIVGQPAASVERVLFAVDPVASVVQEAIDYGADLLVVHHPLLYRPVSAVAGDSPKGRAVHDLIHHGVALYVAHTNADIAPRGVAESLALAVGLTDLELLDVQPADALDKIVVFVPRDAVDKLIDALAEAGAGSLGDYDRCAFVTSGSGTFRPGPRANPAIGEPNRIEVVDEVRVEMVLRRDRRRQVVDALRVVHPYEEPAFDVHELATWASDRGIGRIGNLARPTPLRSFADQVAAALPPTAIGARVAGELDRQVQRVAVVGGAGDFLLDEARRSGVDVYVTSDLRHHPASEFREYDGAPALIDIPHWAAEWTWLPVAQQTLRESWHALGWSIESDVSRLCTDPWNYRADSGRP